MEVNDEIVLFPPYYETPDMVRLVLSGNSTNDKNIKDNLVEYSGINVEKYEKEGSLIVRDSLRAHVDTYEVQETIIIQKKVKKDMDLTSFLCVLNKHAARQQKSGITILLDVGLFLHGAYDHRMQRLEKFEGTIPGKYESNKFKFFCLYHQRDFEGRLSQEQQATLLDYHNRRVMLVTAV